MGRTKALLKTMPYVAWCAEIYNTAKMSSKLLMICRSVPKDSTMKRNTRNQLKKKKKKKKEKKKKINPKKKILK